MWLGGQVVRLRLRIIVSPLSSATLGKLLTHVPLSPSSIFWYQPMGLAAGKVTVGLASHWPHVTDISGFPSMGSRPRRGR